MSRIADRIREVAESLPETLQAQLLEYARQLSRVAVRGIPRKDFEIAGNLLSDEDAEAILRAVEQDCEVIYPDEWEVPD
ncbi:hypothetical protein GXSOP10_1039 [Armatimonadetes bacterium GXS]|nr:hypothetical protein GXSOP10_1039 [Armatimonadetes bacterium GXS]